MTGRTSSQLRSDVRLPVAVKGIKDGLLFLLDEQCEFDVLLSHLEELLNGETAAVFDGPQIGVAIDYGDRTLAAEEYRMLLNLFLTKPNFVIREWGRHTTAYRSILANREKQSQQSIYKGHVRNGQTLYFDGDVVIIGDVHPGAEVSATGDIYVFGRLRGIAHAGVSGNPSAIIAASDFAPMQLRIAGRIGRPPEQNGRAMQTFMEFAYLQHGTMAVDKVEFLSYLRPKSPR
ncbi:septation ring formation regulator EzrA [Alicyclobacillus tolerans]|uniref:septum site-determining protein MinC n=1 Tax=Alicyclobacillus tolerans TaxID=90970 RepID=UPI001F17C310|nr:septum site-determining protein MinC [Alicyclobacillus tolerans]MCF8563556.1 septation ring formation regulator EzrA [Alicyclobacillus tolerans]